MKASWKTTLAGILMALGSFALTLDAEWAKLAGPILLGVGGLLGGVSARDNGVSSEEAGAKK